MVIIGTPFNTASRISCLLSHDLQTVIRYYNFSNSARSFEKCLQLAEAQALAAHSMQIAVVFADVLERVLDPRIAPRRIVCGHAHDELRDLEPDAAPSGSPGVRR